MRCGRQPPKWLTKNEKNALLREAKDIRNPPAHHHMVVLLLSTGLRVAELAALKWPKVKMSDRKGSIEVTGKGRKQRTLRLNADALNALKGLNWKDRGKKDWCVVDLSVRGIQFVVEKLGKRAGLHLSVHMLRHTFAHDMLAAGVPLNQVQEMLGHESPVTTALYLLPSEEELAASVGRISLDGDEPEPETPPPRRKGRR
jgi:site-specific recombinase XerD